MNSHQKAGKPPKAELASCSSEEVSMFLTLAIILAVIWLILWLALHVTSGLIHILIALAVISFIVHLFRGRPATT
jgi:hypothetical protein